MRKAGGGYNPSPPPRTRRPPPSASWPHGDRADAFLDCTKWWRSSRTQLPARRASAECPSPPPHCVEAVVFMGEFIFMHMTHCARLHSRIRGDLDLHFLERPEPCCLSLLACRPPLKWSRAP